ncbi:DUF1488 domain-containing protein [Dickeya lacustris]|uniref:DUF1488 domain-containing protein n=1 Tax=Dickeya lacustris TaxID=2259638 RepID=A0ABY8G464_9GAMM|nr:DUF1488 domain-containing protein [Dickeya lacustris]WFN54733.1 DUF1488 domain-containing protein [Dickeya lacustris]
MNQHIQYPDREAWSDDEYAIVFPVLVGGFQHDCVLGQSTLLARYGNKAPEQWLALFRQHRWDWEEEFERAIRNDEYDDVGRFVLPSDGVNQTDA